MNSHKNTKAGPLQVLSVSWAPGANCLWSISSEIPQRHLRFNRSSMLHILFYPKTRLLQGPTLQETFKQDTHFVIHRYLWLFPLLEYSPAHLYFSLEHSEENLERSWKYNYCIWNSENPGWNNREEKEISLKDALIKQTGIWTVISDVKVLVETCSERETEILLTLELW